MVAAVPFNQQVHDSYFIVAHFHYVLVGGVIFPIIGGLYYWLPKITGRLLDERLGRWNFWVMFIFFNVTFFPMHLAGMRGMPRRIYTYPSGLGWDVPNLISTIGAFGFGIGVLLFLINFGVYGLWRGRRAGRDPWRGDTLEWSNESPPAAAQYPEVPVVRGRHPLWEQEDLEPGDADMRRKLESVMWKPVTWRGALVTTVLDARPRAIAHMPGTTLGAVDRDGVLAAMAGEEPAGRGT
jgi:heme/copper-type cytochrome/quinol oxidase subunit 1